MRERKVELIPGWRSWWRWWSLRLEAMGFFLAMLPPILQALSDSVLLTWSTIPNEIKSTIPDSYIQIMGGVVFALGVVARFFPQRKATEQADADRARRANESEPEKGAKDDGYGRGAKK